VGAKKTGPVEPKALFQHVQGSKKKRPTREKKQGKNEKPSDAHSAFVPSEKGKAREEEASFSGERGVNGCL